MPTKYNKKFLKIHIFSKYKEFLNEKGRKQLDDLLQDKDDIDCADMKISVLDKTIHSFFLYNISSFQNVFHGIPAYDIREMIESSYNSPIFGIHFEICGCPYSCAFCVTASDKKAYPVSTVPFPLILKIFECISSYVNRDTFFHLFDAGDPFFYKDRALNIDFSVVASFANKFNINPRVITRLGGNDKRTFRNRRQLYSLSLGDSNFLKEMALYCKKLAREENLVDIMMKKDKMIIDELETEDIRNELITTNTQRLYPKFLKCYSKKLNSYFRRNINNIKKFNTDDFVYIRLQLLSPSAIKNLKDFVGKGMILVFLKIVDEMITFIYEKIADELQITRHPIKGNEILDEKLDLEKAEMKYKVSLMKIDWNRSKSSISGFNESVVYPLLETKLSQDMWYWPEQTQLRSAISIRSTGQVFLRTGGAQTKKLKEVIEKSNDPKFIRYVNLINEVFLKNQNNGEKNTVFHCSNDAVDNQVVSCIRNIISAYPPKIKQLIKQNELSKKEYERIYDEIQDYPFLFNLNFHKKNEKWIIGLSSDFKKTSWDIDHYPTRIWAFHNKENF